MNFSTRDIVLCAVFAAVLSVFSVITIPTGIIPVTLGLFGVWLTAIALGGKKGVVSVLVFILIGVVGMPVFSGMKGGAGVIIGPTGGYLTSYIFMALITGAVSSKIGGRYDIVSFFVRFAAGLVSLFVCYFFGTVQFVFISGQTIKESLAMCVYPFVIFDLVKCAAAVLIGEQVRKRLPKSSF